MAAIEAARRFAAARIRSADDRDEVVQRVALAFLDACERGKEIRDPGGWGYGAAAKVWAELLRERARQEHGVEDLDTFAKEPNDGELRECARQTYLVWLWRHRKTMRRRAKSQWRAAWGAWNGLSYVGIAQQCRVVLSRAYALIAKLTKRLKKSPGGVNESNV